MKVENMLKIKEEFDYKSLSKKLEVQLDKVIAENERQLKAFDDDVERINQQAQNRISEVEKNFAEALEVGSFEIHLANPCFVSLYLVRSNIMFTEGKTKMSNGIYGVS